MGAPKNSAMISTYKRTYVQQSKHWILNNFFQSSSVGYWCLGVYFSNFKSSSESGTSYTFYTSFLFSLHHLELSSNVDIDISGAVSSLCRRRHGWVRRWPYNRVCMAASLIRPLRVYELWLLSRKVSKYHFTVSMASERQQTTAPPLMTLDYYQHGLWGTAPLVIRGQ